MLGSPSFKQLNGRWNADPNAPDPEVEIRDADLLLRFSVNPCQVKILKQDDCGILRFVNCARYRVGSTNDEGWYRGQCLQQAGSQVGRIL